ncbi:MAG TPA: DNA repair protein RecO [Pyrinomonadaceae bacterium]|jgi:DNA repair protein RecO (recombination protein O)|nr:DNA repair protein RecO [Pyrinomonadaceae bacterium]
MSLFETEALVLRTYNLAEADKIVVCLSRSTGLLRGVAKNCRKLKNRFGASLEPFTLINLTYFEKENQELVSFSQTEILRSRFNLTSDAAVMTGFSYMGDLLMDFAPPRQANDNLYRMALACFEAVSQTPADLEWVLRYFEVWLLKLEGFLPDLRGCANCQDGFDRDEPVYLGADLSLRCLKCSQARGRAIPKSVHQQLRTTEKLSPAKFAEGAREVPVATRKELAQLTYQIISRVLERMPRARPTFVL